jgi:hypothetical protein
MGLAAAVRFIVRESGLGGLYKGVAATIMKQVEKGYRSHFTA